MTLKYDYIINQIEKATQLIAALVSSKKIEHKEETEINQTLSDLTGFGLEFFNDEKNAAVLHILLDMIDDDKKKALVASLLYLKRGVSYREIATQLKEQVDVNKLNPKMISTIT